MSNKIKTVIFYASVKPMNRRSSELQNVFFIGGKPVYVRAEGCVSADVLDALDHAKPRDGETVLNTIEL